MLKLFLLKEKGSGFQAGVLACRLQAAPSESMWGRVGHCADPICMAGLPCFHACVGGGQGVATSVEKEDYNY